MKDRQVSPWVIYQLLPNLQRVSVARFRSRNNAEAYLKSMERMLPHVRFAMTFEVSHAEENDRLQENAIAAWQR